MAKKSLLEKASEKVIVFDGAMGTMLMASGLSQGETPEMWNIEKPSLIRDIHRQYYEAGSDVVHTNTFGGNILKLRDRGLADRMETINMEAARLARDVCPDEKFVAGDIGPTGKMLKPLGDVTAGEMEEAFHEQAKALIKGGVDFLSIETMFSLEEALAAVRGAKRAGPLLIVASTTYTQTKKGFFTMMGESVEQCVRALEAAGVDVIASNCTLGSREMIDLTKEMRTLTEKPLLIQPNAGKPLTRKGVTYYEQSPLEFAEDCGKIKEAGADMIGGCCGTNAEFMRALVAEIE